MADSPINGFTLIKTDTPNGSYFGFDWWSGTEWKTVKIRAEDLASALTANVENFVSADLVGVADRNHNFNDYALSIIKCKQINLEAGTLLPSGQPSVKIVGYGSTASEIAFNFNTSSATALSILGDLTATFNGKVIIGSTIGANTKLEVVASGSTRAITALSTGAIAINGADGTGQGVRGSTITGFGVLGNATGNGTGVYGQSVGGVAGHMDGGLLVETYGFGSSPTSSSVATFNATDKGILIPRLTTTQRDSISLPATGLEIFNTTTNRFEHWNGTYWAGQRNVINIFHGEWSDVANGQTVAFGAMPIAPQSSAPLFSALDIVLRGNGVIRACTLNAWCSGTVGTGENWSLYIRHNSTNYLVASVGNTNAIKVFQNTSLNIPYVDGDTMKMIFVNPTWATNPANVISQGTVTTE